MHVLYACMLTDHVLVFESTSRLWMTYKEHSDQLGVVFSVSRATRTTYINTIRR